MVLLFFYNTFVQYFYTAFGTFVVVLRHVITRARCSKKDDDNVRFHSVPQQSSSTLLIHGKNPILTLSHSTSH